MTEMATARQLGLALCHDCHMLVDWAGVRPEEAAYCPRCGARVHLRKPNSLKRTWALLIAAAVLYFPANLLPITVTTSLGSEQSDTIISGVLYFLRHGSIGIGLVILIASVLIPLTKILVLTYLLLTVHSRSLWRPKDRTRLYRMIEAVGRWSMVDIFVVTILVALVKLGALANVDAGPATIYFAAVVILTMLATESFDPRLMWDIVEENYERGNT